MKLFEVVIIGVISGIISSVIVSSALLVVKPRITLSNFICMDSKNRICRIKVVNRTHANLMDVKYSLHLCHRFPDRTILMTPVVFRRNDINFLHAYSASDKDALYAIRFGFCLTDEILAHSDDYLSFTLSAKHSRTGTTAFFSKDYQVKDIKCGKFETRISDNIIDCEHCGTLPLQCGCRCTASK